MPRRALCSVGQFRAAKLTACGFHGQVEIHIDLAAGLEDDALALGARLAVARHFRRDRVVILLAGLQPRRVEGACRRSQGAFDTVHGQLGVRRHMDDDPCRSGFYPLVLRRRRRRSRLDRRLTAPTRRRRYSAIRGHAALDIARAAAITSAPGATSAAEAGGAIATATTVAAGEAVAAATPVAAEAPRATGAAI